jgi:hypothetical protein
MGGMDIQFSWWTCLGSNLALAGREAETDRLFERMLADPIGCR